MPLQVLIVEDDAPSAELLKEFLAEMGTGSIICQRSIDAARRVNEQGFDGIFLDLMMPGIDGFDLARMIRASSWNKRTPIIIVSGRPESDTMGKAFDVGGTFYLRKPIDRTKLLKLFSAVRGSLLHNQRRFLRVPLLTHVTIFQGALPLSGRSRNISLGGMLCETDRPFDLGARIRVTFTLPQQPKLIECLAIVQRQDARLRIGMSFVDLPLEARERILDLISSSAA